MRLWPTALATLLIAVGVAVIARTVEAGVGGGLGLLLGALFVVAGSGRLYVARRG